MGGKYRALEARLEARRYIVRLQRDSKTDGENVHGIRRVSVGAAYLVRVRKTLEPF